MTEVHYSGKIALISEIPGQAGKDIGWETWDVSLHADGLRALRARCVLTDDPPVFRDILQSVDKDYHPHDGFARIVVDGKFRGSAWYNFSDTLAECEALTAGEGRLSQTFPISRAMRGFGTHSLQSDAWLLARYDYSKGPGRQRFLNNLMTTTNHRGATGPMFMTTNSSLEYVGKQSVTVPAGTFDCHHLRFVETSHDHPPYDMFVTADDHFIFVKGVLGGPNAQRYELTELTQPAPFSRG